MLSLFLIAETITDKGFYHLEINNSENITLQTSQYDVFILSKNQMTGNLNFNVTNDGGSTIIDSTDQGISSSIRIQKSNVTLFSSGNNTLDIFILDEGACSDTSFIAQSSYNFSFSLNSSSDKNICVFPYEFPENLSISIEGNYKFYIGDASNHEFKENTNTSDFLLNESCYVSMDDKQISIIGNNTQPLSEESDCAALIFKILSGSSVTMPSNMPNYTMSCEHNKFHVKSIQSLRPPWVVIILLILLILFCIASGIYSCTHRTNSQLK